MKSKRKVIKMKSAKNIIITILSVLLVVSLCFNIILLINNSEYGASNSFDKKLIGTWCYSGDDFIIEPDGNYNWISYSYYFNDGDINNGVKCIGSVTKGYIDNYEIVVTAEYDRFKLYDRNQNSEEEYYSSCEEIPEEKWNIYDKKGSRGTIIMNGASFDIKTHGDHMTNYHFVKQ